MDASQGRQTPRKIFGRVPPEAWKDPEKLREFAREMARSLRDQAAQKKSGSQEKT
jgi:hypothetical protein